MINGKNVSLKLDGKTILDDVSFQVQKGKITSFIGKSGAGKTSLLKCIANLYSDYTGEIKLEQKNIKNLNNKERAQHIGFVSQHLNLFPHMTVLQNCTHPITTVLKTSKEAAHKKAISVLKSLEIESLKNAYPEKLSGGQQQRVAIARALCMEPEVILLDEPTSALDPHSTKSLQGLIKKLHQRGTTIALSSHDMPFVKSTLDCAYFLRNGKIVDQIDVKKEELKSTSPIYEFLLNEQD
jgi:polar amino acid transport system ATP-binding protein